LLIEQGIVVVTEYASFNESVLPFRDQRVWEKLGIPYEDFYFEKSLEDKSNACDLMREQVPEGTVKFPSKLDFSKLDENSITASDATQQASATEDAEGVDVATRIEYKLPIFDVTDMAGEIVREKLDLNGDQDKEGDMHKEDGPDPELLAGARVELDDSTSCAFEVEKIMPNPPKSHWRVLEGNTLEPQLHLRIKWKDFSQKHNSWVLASEVADGAKKRAYFEKYGADIKKEGAKLTGVTASAVAMMASTVYKAHTHEDLSFRLRMADELISLDGVTEQGGGDTCRRRPKISSTGSPCIH
jgi:hypothetical protein